ncbi:hypothetical protein BJ875DRAFT_473148 [Amylocarpus encephaloides]|uniref:Uncharacterized protein n=1 Tax=Amylocarpus encephaloides TaxID=45428 RepID=A0A9P7YAF5_9HELO|nr:hypothetical protein BJ875DRAFT_473148 [Amylocarpus encephaloides]
MHPLALLPLLSSISALATPRSEVTIDITCQSNDNIKWVPQQTIQDAIDRFCPEATQQGTQDQNSGGIFRVYNGGTVFELSLSMEWASGSNFKPDLELCKVQMGRIMACVDTNNNPLGWRHGGHVQDATGSTPVGYIITPISTRYSHGNCGLHLRQGGEHVLPGYQDSYAVTLKDAKNNELGKSSGAIGEGTTTVKLDNRYYSLLTIEWARDAEKRGYIDTAKFNLGSQSWTPATQCKVGNWDYGQLGNGPWYQDMDCGFQC